MLDLNSGLRAAMRIGAMIGAAALLGACEFHAGPFIARCTQDSDISTSDRKAIEQAALAFADKVIAGDSQPAYSLTSKAMRAEVSPQRLADAIHTLHQLPDGVTIGPAKVAATYHFDVFNMSGGTAQTMCGEDLSNHSHFNIFTLSGAAQQAHVLLNADFGPDQDAIDVWMSREDGSWRVIGFYFNMSKMNGHDGLEMWQRAKEQRALGHDFNAGMLYIAADALLSRGPYVQLGVRQDFDKDRSSFTYPASQKGPPFNWNLGGQQFTLTRVNISGDRTPGQIMLTLDQRAQSSDEHAADALNHALIDGFVKAHPDWTETFDVILARAWYPNSSKGYATRFNRASGYVQAQH